MKTLYYIRAILVVFIFLQGNLLISQNRSPISYQGTKQELKEFIANEMTYPRSALERKEQGEVRLQFIVNQHGAAQNIEVIKGLGAEINEEAIRILKKMIWQPSLKYGKAIAARHEITIPFNLRKYKRYCKLRGYVKQCPDSVQIDTGFVVYKMKATNPSPHPKFVGSSANLGRFIQKEMQYPVLAFKQNISGIVRLEFVVEPNGCPSHFKIINSVGGGCDQEAIRIVKKIRWDPGQINKTLVRTKMKLDIAFRLSENQNMEYFYNNQNSSM
jgi:bla regulator protein blaR1